MPDVCEQKFNHALVIRVPWIPRPRIVRGLINLLILLFFVLGASVGVLTAGQTTATLRWNPSPSESVSGYRVYFGAESGGYTNTTDVGNSTEISIPGLEIGVTYYFVVSAYDATGVESDYSNEVGYTPTISSTVSVLSLQLQVAGVGQIFLTGTGPVGRTYDIQASSDLQNWTVIGRMTVDAAGVLNFTDPDAGKYSARFYRAMETRPDVQLRIAPGSQVIITVIGQNNHTYDLEASSNLQDWTVIRTVTLGPDGAIEFPDSRAAIGPAQFYRTHEIQP